MFHTENIYHHYTCCYILFIITYYFGGHVSICFDTLVLFGYNSVCVDIPCSLTYAVQIEHVEEGINTHDRL